ncbi:MAG: tRNA dihydrouridine synthase DusB [Treponema sp.]|nr:tRNA dihydrouridine synthase DusB [Treponema sp.]
MDLEKPLYHPVKIGPLELEGNLFLAPVAGYSDRAFRSVCWAGGVNFCYTEMVSAEALSRGNEKTETLMNRSPSEKAYSVQIFGGEASTMAKAARVVLEKTSTELIDINGGCPVPKIVKTGAGSMLTKEPERLYSIVKAVVEECKLYAQEYPERGVVPVSVKIRSGWDSEHITWKEAAAAALEAGASAITLHARTRAQGYEGKADWSLLAELVEMMKGKIPVFGSGDAFSPEDAKNMLSQTACDAVMFARGAMGNPFIFAQTRQFLLEGRYDDIPVKDRIKAGFTQLEQLILDRGEEVACRDMRKSFCAYSKGIPGGAKLRAQIVSAKTKSEYKQIFSSAIANLSCS